MHYRVTAQLTRKRNAESHDKAVSHCFFSDQQFHRPGPNLNCRLRIRCASSIPARVTAAVRLDLKPNIGRQRRLIARWSCSTILFRYWQLRTRTYIHRRSSRRSRRSAQWLCLCPSSVILRGHRGAQDATALRKKAIAEAIPRLVWKSDSTVFPCLSTARYR